MKKEMGLDTNTGDGTGSYQERQWTDPTNFASVWALVPDLLFVLNLNLSVYLPKSDGRPPDMKTMPSKCGSSLLSTTNFW